MRRRKPRAARTWLLLWLLLLAGFAACRGAVETAESPGPLIPLDSLFATPAYDAPQISPDGKWIAYFGPLDGVPNLFVAPADDIAAARPATRFSGRGLQPRDVSGQVMARWTWDSRRVLLPIDQDGDENWNLHAVDVSTGEIRNLTPLENVRVELLALSREQPNRALVSIADRAPPLADLYLLDIDTGTRELLEENPGFVGYIADNDLRPRLALALNADGGLDFFSSKAEGGWTAMFSVSEEDLPAISASGYQKIVRFDRANRRVFFYDSRGRDTSALVSLDLESGSLEVIADDERVDLGGVLYHPTDNLPEAFATNWTRTEWHSIGASIAADLAFLEDFHPGDFRVVSRAASDDRWIVRTTLAHQPEAYWLYERQGDSAPRMTMLFVTTPELEPMQLSEMYAVVTKSSDGLDLVSYLSYPPWLDSADGRPLEPVPLVVLVHGGPSDERAQYAFGPFVHWLANRGYGVFYVNFRGSPGFGKSFLNAQRMEWGGRMHDDILDQVEWAIAEGITRRDQVAIVGGSYGGYEVLVGMTMTPDVFACGIDLVGPSNLEIFMPHWNVDTMSRVLGDPRTEEGRRFLRSRSPIRFAHQAKNPILIGQGARDSRVPQDQSDSMVDILEANGAPVTYVLYPDEGHGLLRPENSLSFWAIAEVFLGECLGGRYQEIGAALEGSSAQVLAGADLLPGLSEALIRRNQDPL